jgi:hypothetical protein
MLGSDTSLRSFSQTEEVNVGTRVVASVAMAMLSTTIACDGEAPAGPNSPPDELPLFMQQTDTVYWEDNVLEFTDENGADWRLVRDQQSATEVEFFRNDTSVVAYEFEWNGSTVEEIRTTEPTQSHWVEAETDGSILDSSGGSSPNPCGSGGPCVEFFSGDCEEEWDEAEDAGYDALGSGLIALATAGAPGVNTATAASFAIFGGLYAGRVLSLGVCLVT